MRINYKTFFYNRLVIGLVPVVRSAVNEVRSVTVWVPNVWRSAKWSARSWQRDIDITCPSDIMLILCQNRSVQFLSPSGRAIIVAFLSPNVIIRRRTLLTGVKYIQVGRKLRFWSISPFIFEMVGLPYETGSYADH